MNVSAILVGILPSVGVLGIFVYVMRGITRGDRRERDAIARYDREQSASAAKLTEAHRESESGETAP